MFAPSRVTQGRKPGLAQGRIVTPDVPVDRVTETRVAPLDLLDR